MHVSEFLRICITVSDLQRAEQFYCEGLGFARGDETIADDPSWADLMGLPPSASQRAVRLRLGVQEVELAAFQPAGRPYPALRASDDQWFQHIAIAVSDIDEAWSRLERQSPSDVSVGGPQRLPANTGGVGAFKFRDPDGHPLELLYFPPGIGDPVWHRDQSSESLGYDHSAIVVEDIGRSLAFYVDLLGFRIGSRSLNKGVEQERLDGLPADIVDVVGLAPAEVPTPHLELLRYRQPKHTVQISDVQANDVASTRQVHRVDRLDDLMERLKNAGTTFVSPGVVSLVGGDRAATIRDPDGHMIVLTQ